MPIDVAKAKGAETAPSEGSWGPDDVILYQLGIGAAAVEPGQRLGQVRPRRLAVDLVAARPRVGRQRGEYLAEDRAEVELRVVRARVRGVHAARVRTVRAPCVAGVP